jgi:hypothetical protein
MDARIDRGSDCVGAFGPTGLLLAVLRSFPMRVCVKGIQTGGLLW